jgi:hypothetical protein
LISMNYTPWRFAGLALLALAAALASPAALATTGGAAPSSPTADQRSADFTYDPGFAASGQGQVAGQEGARRLTPQMPCCGDATVCWSTTTTRSRGIWPYGRAIHLYTLWCALGGTINYRYSSAWSGVDVLCSSNNIWWGKVGGGTGWSFVDVQAQAEFSCDSPFWFDWHDFLMQRIRYHGNGWYELIGYQ